MKDNASLDGETSPSTLNPYALFNSNYNYFGNVNTRPANSHMQWRALDMKWQENNKMKIVRQAVESQGKWIADLTAISKRLSQQNASLVNTVNRIENMYYSLNQHQKQEQQQRQPTTTPLPPPANPRPHEGERKTKITTYTNDAGKAAETPFQIITKTQEAKPP